MTAAEHQRLVREREAFKAECARLRGVIRQHQRDVQGPGPAVDFGAADARLYAALPRPRLAVVA